MLEDLEILFCSYKVNEFKLQIPATISCHNPKSLSLSNVYFDEAIFNNIASSCPMIKFLKLSSCINSVSINLSPIFLQAKFLKSLIILSKELLYIDCKFLRIYIVINSKAYIFLRYILMKGRLRI